MNNMTEDQEYCRAMLSEWVCGAHHLPKVHEWGSGICINHHGDLSTFDFDRLTRLVLLAHRDCIRVEIASSGPGMVRIICHRRIKIGSISERHPSLIDLRASIDALLSTEQ